MGWVEELVTDVVGAVEESSTFVPEVGGKVAEPTMESSRNEASNTSSSLTIQVVSTSAFAGQGVLLPVPYSSVLEVARSSITVEGEAAADDRR